MKASVLHLPGYGFRMKYPANDASDNLISITADVSPNGAGLDLGMLFFINGVPQQCVDSAGNMEYISKFYVDAGETVNKDLSCAFNNVMRSDEYVCRGAMMTSPDTIVTSKKSIVMGFLQDIRGCGAAKIECSRNDVVDLEVGDKYQYTFEFKRIFYVLILMILTMFGTSCAKENTFINTEYKDLEIHGDYIINEIGTVGNAYYYSYYSEDESRCQICRFDLISNELREIKAFDTKQLDRIVVVENGYEKIFLDLEEYVILHNTKCYNSDKYFVIEASAKDMGRPVVVFYDYTTEEFVIIENRKLIGRSEGNEYILMQNHNPVNEKESECIYVFSV